MVTNGNRKERKKHLDLRSQKFFLAPSMIKTKQRRVIQQENVVMNLPKEVLEFTCNASLSRINTGRSGAEVFKVPLRDTTCGYLKVGTTNFAKSEIEREVKVLSWLEDKLVVPKTLTVKTEGNSFYFLVSEISGRNLADICREIGSRMTLTLAARFMRGIHSINISDCPFARGLDNTLQFAKDNLMNGLVDDSDFDKERLGRSGEELVQELEHKTPLKQDLVFTHGDYCLPNIIFFEGDIRGVVDLGRAGISDRYQDIALFLRSFESNLEKPDSDLFVREYGLIKTIDYEKIEFYKLLDEFF